MIRISFSQEEIAELQHERYYHEHPRVRKKMETLWLKSQEKAHQEICQLAGISKATLVDYLKQYQSGGIARLKELHFYQPQSELLAYAGEIKEAFTDKPPASLKEAVTRVEALTGIRRSEVQMSHFLKQQGFRARRVGSIRAKLDPKAQEDFLKKNWSLA